MFLLKTTHWLMMHHHPAHAKVISVLQLNSKCTLFIKGASSRIIFNVYFLGFIVKRITCWGCSRTMIGKHCMASSLLWSSTVNLNTRDMLHGQRCSTLYNPVVRHGHFKFQFCIACFFSRPMLFFVIYQTGVYIIIWYDRMCTRLVSVKQRRPTVQVKRRPICVRILFFSSVY